MVVANDLTRVSNNQQLRCPEASEECRVNYLLPDEFKICGFDVDDFLWVAGAFNAPQAAVILNAIDSDYGEHIDQLQALPVNVQELCPVAA